MNPEILQPTDSGTKISNEILVKLNAFGEEQISELITSRKQLLESIKNQISLKAYYLMEEKILKEETRLKEILDIKKGRQRQLSKFTFILDPRFFEQEFLN